MSEMNMNQETHSIVGHNLSVSRSLFITGTLLLLFISWSQELWRFPFNHDSGVILDTSRRLLDGEKLYTDIPEVNPPMIFVLGSTIALMAKITGIHEILVWKISFLLAITMVFLFSGQILTKSGWALENGRTQSFFWAILALCFCYSGYDFSQREHLAAVFFLPYLLICLGRSNEKPVIFTDALLAGVIAGFAFSLKPFFLLVFCLVEIYMWGALRKIEKPWLRIESVVFVFFSGLIYSWIIFGTPYLSFIRFIQPYYASYNVPISRILYNANLFPVALATLLHFIFEPPKNERHLRQLFFLTTMGFTISYIIQMKGFSYHSLPARFFSWLLIAIIIIDLSSSNITSVSPIRNIAWQFSSKFYVFLIIFIVFQSGLNIFNSSDEDVQELINQISNLGKGKKVQLLTFSIHPAFPAFNYCGLQTTQRGSAPILAKIFYGKDSFKHKFPYTEGLESDPLAQSYIDTTVEDIRTKKPDYIFSDDRLFRQAIGFSRFNFIEFLMLDKRFQSIFRNYSFYKESNGFKIFKKRTEE